jgi:hypothetical protein
LTLHLVSWKSNGTEEGTNNFWQRPGHKMHQHNPDQSDYYFNKKRKNNLTGTVLIQKFLAPSIHSIMKKYIQSRKTVTELAKFG